MFGLLKKKQGGKPAAATKDANPPKGMNKLKSLAASANNMTRRKTQHIFEIVTRAQYSDPEFDELLLQLKAFEEDVDTLRKKFEPFVQASRQYCSVLEGASLQAWVMSHRLTGMEKKNDVDLLCLRRNIFLLRDC